MVNVLVVLETTAEGLPVIEPFALNVRPVGTEPDTKLYVTDRSGSVADTDKGVYTNLATSPIVEMLPAAVVQVGLAPVLIAFVSVTCNPPGVSTRKLSGPKLEVKAWGVVAVMLLVLLIETVPAVYGTPAFVTNLTVEPGKKPVPVMLNIVPESPLYEVGATLDTDKPP